MAVLPVSSIDSKTRNVSFGRKRNVENPVQNQEMSISTNKAGSMVTIPTALFIALATGAYNSNEAKAIEPEDAKTEVLAPQQSRSKIYEVPYSYDSKYVQMKKDVKLLDGRTVTMYYINHSPNNDNVSVSDVKLVPEGFKTLIVDGQECNFPYAILSLRYHRLSDDGSKDFVGAVVSHTESDKVGHDRTFYVEEMRLPDRLAEELLDLYFGDVKYKHVKGRKRIEVVDTPDILPTTTKKLRSYN